MTQSGRRFFRDFSRINELILGAIGRPPQAFRRAFVLGVPDVEHPFQPLFYVRRRFMTCLLPKQLACFDMQDIGDAEYFLARAEQCLRLADANRQTANELRPWATGSWLRPLKSIRIEKNPNQNESQQRHRTRGLCSLLTHNGHPRCVSLAGAKVQSASCQPDNPIFFFVVTRR
jgi:hypothetical protein